MNVQLANTYNPEKNYRVSLWYASPKLDGVRAVFIPQRGLFTRSNNHLNGFSHMEQSLEIICKQSGLSFIDGELVIKGRSFQASQGVILASEHDDKSLVEFHVFAVGGSFPDTASMLKALPEDSQHNIFRVNSELIPNTFDAIENACRNFTNKGYEGVMLRNPEINYSEGRGNNLLKYKFFNEADLEIMSINSDRSVTVQGKINNQDIRCNVRFTGENLIGQFLSVKYQSITDRPDKEGFYSLRFPSAIGIKSDRDFQAVTPKPKSEAMSSGRLIYHKNGFVEANFQIVFVDKPMKKRLSFIPEKSTMAEWRKQLFRCRTLDEGVKLFAELRLTVPQIMEFAKYLGVKLTGCMPIKSEIIARIVRVSLGAKLIAEKFFILT